MGKQFRLNYIGWVLYCDGTPDELYDNGKITEAFGISVARIETKDGISYTAMPKNLKKS